MTSDLQFHVVIDSSVPSNGDVVYFRAGVLASDTVASYEDVDGFYQELISGRPLPMTFWTPAVHDEWTLVALALFLHRDLAIQPSVPSLLALRPFLTAFPVWGGAHVDRDLGRFLGFLRAFVPQGLTQQDMGDRVGSAVGWIRSYLLDGTLPQMPDSFKGVRVLDRGSNGFVLAESLGQDLEGDWVELFRLGHLRGLLLGQPSERSRPMLIARKTPWATLNLEQAESALNELEIAMGGDPEWAIDGDRIKSPSAGSILAVSHVLAVLTRV